ncbi:helix-turn-helix domain-containing protein [Niallia circulans]|uniref:Helix-turn-helix transcriptional regulator n=2 Tax=Bacillaceae TaxID=186817 RepID=A0A941GH48_NIACI|nr:helix-turn-helix transcriptional regulator [Niallia circulans]MCB5237156.1 helix-turn-helix domain-containing protein [Niallia circulans]
MKSIPQRDMKPIKEKVAIRLKAIQKEYSLSLSEMAMLLEIPKATLNSYLRGLALPPLSVVEKFNFSDLDVEWLYYGDIVEYIGDYLLFRGHGKFLDSHPNTPQMVYLMYDITTSGSNPSEKVSLTDKDIERFFEKYYRECIKQVY